jgi:O-antigen/teichoic acid export membrane protein
MSDRDQRGIFGSVGLTVAGQGAAFAAGFLCMLLTTRLLGPEGYGKLALFFMALECGALLLSWPNLGLVRFGREELAQDRAFGRAFAARMLLFAACAAAAAALAWALRDPVGRYLGIDSREPAMLLLAYLVINELIFALRAVFQTAGAFTGYGVISAGVRVLNLLFIAAVFLLLGRRASAGAIIWTQLASLAVVLAAALLWLPWGRLRGMRADRPTAARIAAYSWPVIFWSMASLLVNWTGLVLVQRHCPAAEVGCFAVAWQAVTVLTALQVAAVNAVTPMLMSMAVEKRYDRLTAYVERALPQIAWALGLGCLVLGAAAEAIPFLLGSAYAGAVLPTQVLLAGVAFGAFASFQEALAKALDRVKATALVMLVLAALSVALSCWLTPRLGVAGAAVASTAAFALSALLYAPIIESFRALHACGSPQRCLAYSGLLAPVFFAMAALTLPTPPARLLAAGAILALWLALARWMNVFEAATMASLRDVRMPQSLRRAVGGFYRLMGR